MKTKTIITTLLVFFVLASCAPTTQAAATVVPTETESAIPTSTLTLTPIPTATASITPSPAPENLADAKDLPMWINEFVHAYGSKITVNGVEMNAIQLTDEIRKNGGDFTQVIEINGVAYSFLVVNDIPLVFMNQNQKWEFVSINKLMALNGIRFGFTPEFSNDYENPNWKRFLKDAGIVVPAGGCTARVFVEWPTVIPEWMKLSKQYNTPIRFNSGFMNNQGYDLPLNDPIANETDPQKIEAFMREYIRKALSYQPDEINIVLEPYQLQNGQIVWNHSIYYKAFGENWIEQAFAISQDELEKLKSEGVVKKDIKFYWNDWGIDGNGEKLNFTLEYIKAMKQKGIKVDGIGIQTYPSTPFYTHIPNSDELTDVTQRIKDLGLDFYFEYGVFRGYNDKVIPVGADMFKAALQLHPTSFVIWDEFNRGVAPTLFSEDYLPNTYYFDLLREFFQVMKDN